MITEDFVTFELAKLLKEKGFDEYGMYFYTLEDEGCEGYKSNRTLREFAHNSHPDLKDRAVSCPTLQMAKKWLKVVHNIGIFPSTYTFSSADGSEDYHPYGCAVIDLKTHELLTNNIFPRGTEEDTVEEAIKFCLKNLI